MEKDAEEIRKIVREKYADIARGQQTSCCPPSTTQSSSCPPQTTAHRSTGLADILYSKEELESLPESVTDVALGCGNPVADAELQSGEVVLDLGSDGGLDCFLAAHSVGDRGQVIGVDMTPDMISLARDNARKMDARNVEFRLGEMEHLPVESGSVDVILSNCVINLSPNKDAVFREAFRVLKPGGRVCVSDIMLLAELPDAVKQSLEQWAGCVAGALHRDDYLDRLRAAGFTNVVAEQKGAFGCCDWASNIISATVTASKPA